MENKTSKYFKYAIGEIILVVIGILIALQINNWNENRKINNLKQNYYQQILVDLETDKTYAEYTINRLDSSLTIYNTYNETFKEPNLPFPVILQNMLQNEFGNFVAKFESTTIKALISNGDVKLMNTDLRNNLISYNAAKEHVLDIYRSNSESALDILKEVTMDGAMLTFSSKLQNQAELAKIVNIENRYPEIFIKIEAYLVWKSEAEQRAIDGLQDLLKDMDSATELIQAELKQ